MSDDMSDIVADAKIIEAAVEIIDRRGFDGTDLKAWAKGVLKPRPVWWNGDKDSLVVRCGCKEYSITPAEVVAFEKLKPALKAFMNFWTPETLSRRGPFKETKNLAIALRDVDCRAGLACLDDIIASTTAEDVESLP